MKQPVTKINIRDVPSQTDMTVKIALLSSRALISALVFFSSRFIASDFACCACIVISSA